MGNALLGTNLDCQLMAVKVWWKAPSLGLRTVSPGGRTVLASRVGLQALSPESPLSVPDTRGGSEVSRKTHV